MKIIFSSKFPVTCHTKHVAPGSTFVAIKGNKQDGTQHIPKAIKCGATKIVTQNDTVIPQEIKSVIEQSGAELELVENPRLALAQLSAKASEYAHKKIKIIGITGTKGKTSTSFMLEHLLQSAGYKTALISTVHNKILHKKLKSTLTTEQPDYLHHFFACCADNEVEYVIMEVAAQALSLHRVYGLEFDHVIFTNFSQEHGEFYKNLHDYFEAKCKLFNQLKPGATVFINTDDEWCKKILQDHPEFLSFGIENNTSNFHAKIIEFKKSLTLIIQFRNTPYEVSCPTIFGAFNAYNILAAFSIAHSIGISLKDCCKYIQTFKGVPGRLQLHKLKNGALCFIDYAHNPSSYKAVLSTLREMSDHLITVFGAGGERDYEKRPIMGNIASQIADNIILTSDNPRSEDVNTIIDNITSGILKENKHKIIKEVDRKIAIETACILSKKQSIIAILGKGPDEYQDVNGIKTKFSEKEIIKQFQ